MIFPASTRQSSPSRRTSKVQSLLPSDQLLANAFELAQQPISCGPMPHGREWYVPCASDKHGVHVVTMTPATISCDCQARGLCKHILASVGRPALMCLIHMRWAQDAQELEEILDAHKAAILPIPEALKVFVRRELHHRREQVRRTAGSAVAGWNTDPPERQPASTGAALREIARRRQDEG